MRGFRWSRDVPSATPASYTRSVGGAQAEALEPRRLFSVTVDESQPGRLVVNGDEFANTIRIEIPDDDVHIYVHYSGIREGYYRLRNPPITEIEVNGNGGNDTITIDSNVTFFCYLRGGAGNDTIRGGGAADWIEGGDENDFIYGGDGSDERLYGGSGHDLIAGEKGADIMWGGTGGDTLYGGYLSVPSSYYYGAVTEESDKLYGGDGGDFLYGDTLGHEAIFWVQGGADELYGEGDGDSMWGYGGNDQLTGGAGSDYFDGGNGNDSLFARDGEYDSGTGGAGDDSTDKDLFDSFYS